MNPAESDALHDRVTRFALDALARGGASPGEFDALAVEIARFQARAVPGFSRLVHARGAALSDAASIPGVPVDAFRVTRIAAHPAELDAACFATSGTTSSATGRHYFRTTRTYRTLALAMGERALASAWSGPRVVVALAANPAEAEGPEQSSLAFMMRAFMEEWDARPLDGEAAFDARSPARWLLGSRGIDVRGLRRAAQLARERDEPLLVLATGYALVLLMDALGDERIEAPERTVVMPTGGFKGRTRSIEPADLVRGVSRAFSIDPRHVVGEYGMTELSSQLYEGTLPGGALAGPRGVYLEPPWLRVTAVDPVHLEPVRDGEVGLARIVDLANVDSAVAIVTQDRVRRRDGGVELCGRSEAAPPRGCSLAVEALVLGEARSGEP